jgi:hypothetical protein
MKRVRKALREQSYKCTLSPGFNCCRLVIRHIFQRILEIIFRQSIHTAAYVPRPEACVNKMTLNLEL